MREVVNTTKDGRYELVKHVYYFDGSYYLELEDEDGDEYPLEMIDELDWTYDLEECLEESHDVNRHWREDEADYYRSVL